jgi:hypothetical protein
VTTTTTRAAGACTVHRSYEHSLLRDGEHTPLERAEAFGLPLADYLAEVYPDRTPAPLAEPPTPGRNQRHRRREPATRDPAVAELRARAVIDAITADPQANDTTIAEATGASRNVVAHIRTGRAWKQLPRPWAQS